MRNRFVHKLTIGSLLGLFAIGTLSACGIKGELKTPPPIWGDKSKAEQTQTDKAEAEKSKQASDKSKP